MNTSCEVVTEMHSISSVLDEFKNTFGLIFEGNYTDSSDLTEVRVRTDMPFGSFKDRYDYVIKIVKNNFDVCEELYNKRFLEFSQYYNNLDILYNFEITFLRDFYELMYKILYYSYADIYCENSDDIEYAMLLFSIRDRIILRKLGNSVFNRKDILFSDYVGKSKYTKIKIPSKLLYNIIISNNNNLFNSLLSKAKDMFIDGLLDLDEMVEFNNLRENYGIMSYKLASKVSRYE